MFIKLQKSKRVLLLINCVVCLLFQTVYSQSHQDSTGRFLNNKVRIFSQSFQYDSAVIYSELAAKAYKREGNFEWQANATFGQSFYLSRLGRFDEAVEVVESIMNLSDTLHAYVKSRGYRTLGSIEIDRGDLDKAEDYIKLSVDLEIAGDTIRYLQLKTMGHHYLGMVYGYKDLNLSSIAQYEKAIKYYEDMLPEINANEIYTQYNLGTTLGRIGITNKAIEILLHSGDLILERMEYPEGMMSYVYLSLGSRYRDIGVLNQASEYFEKALIQSQKANPNHPNITLILNGLADLRLQQGRFDESLELTNKSLEKSKSMNLENDRNTNEAYDNLGDYYRYIKNYEAALEAYRTSLEISIASKSTISIGSSHTKIGRTLCLLESYEEGIKEIKKGLVRLKEEDDGLNLRYVDEALYLGDVYFDIDEIDSALAYFNKSLEKSMRAHEEFYGSKYGSVLNNLLDYSTVEILTNKAYTLEKIYRRDQDLSKLKNLLPVIQQADSVFNQLKEKSNLIEDAINLRLLALEINNIGVRVSNQLFEETNEAKYFDLAWRFSESNKGNLILGQLQLSDQSKNLNVPDSMINKIYDLNQEIAYLESTLNSFDNDTTVYKDNRIADYESFLFDAKEELLQINALLKSEYPSYYQLKYEHVYATVSDMQQQLLGRDDLLISFHIGQDYMYVFEIENSSRKIRKVKLNEAFDLNIIAFLNQLDNPSTKIDTYLEANNKLVSQLFTKGETFQDVKNLIIIPDGKLSLIPFGPLVLISPEFPDSVSFSSLNYLLKSHLLSYGTSATSLLRQSADTKDKEVKIMGLAPFSENMPMDIQQQADVARAKAGLLRWSKVELDHIANHFNIDQFVGGKASKTEMTKSLNDYTVLHIASHGLMNDQNPLFSQILFNKPDSIEASDGFLSALEVYNLSLPAEMVVLSACFSGAGVEASGEGVISMASSFFYAGSKNVIMTLWQANDQSTSDLMGDFYQYLAEGETKNGALRLAKLDYLENADNLRAHPYYWAHFISSGNQNALISSGLPGFIWFLFGLVALVVFVVGIKNRRAAS